MEGNKRYRAYFKHLELEDKGKFKNSKCLLPISIGRHYHEGKKFESTLELVNKSFSECTVLIADTLQRHTIGMYNQDKSEHELERIALEEGDKWLEHNGNSIRRILKIPYTISRWNSWVSDATFNTYHDMVSSLYANNTDFNNAIEETITDFFSRSSKIHSTPNTHYIRQCSIKYLLEESAVVCALSKTKSNFLAYPGAKNKAIYFAYEKICDDNIEFLKYLSLVFNKIAYKH